VIEFQLGDVEPDRDYELLSADEIEGILSLIGLPNSKLSLELSENNILSSISCISIKSCEECSMPYYCNKAKTKQDMNRQISNYCYTNKLHPELFL